MRSTAARRAFIRLHTAKLRPFCRTMSDARMLAAKAWDHQAAPLTPAQQVIAAQLGLGARQRGAA
jgi:hypothetical protein